VLPPLDLAPIRNLLLRTDLEVQAIINNDGHRMIAVLDGAREVAWVHHDGRVETTTANLLDA
jgi:hypothetical protein